MTREEWIALVRTFHVFRSDQFYGDPALDMMAFERRVSAGGGSGARHAMAFLWNVWTGGDAPNCGAFNLSAAWATWDKGMQEAWKAWAKDPRFG